MSAYTIFTWRHIPEDGILQIDYGLMRCATVGSSLTLSNMESNTMGCSGAPSFACANWTPESDKGKAQLSL
jgi:hypothetical protein